MTDDRTRIAKVIWKVFQNTPPTSATDDEWEAWWNDSTQDEKALCYAQADAVMRELGLTTKRVGATAFSLQDDGTWQTDDGHYEIGQEDGGWVIFDLFVNDYAFLSEQGGKIDLYTTFDDAADTLDSFINGGPQE